MLSAFIISLLICQYGLRSYPAKHPLFFELATAVREERESCVLTQRSEFSSCIQDELNIIFESVLGYKRKSTHRTR